jgi:ketosteroid isomerase-like protein
MINPMRINYNNSMKFVLPALIFLILISLALTGCDETKKHERRVKDLLEIDRQFSKESADNGSHSAFLKYIDDSCVLLRPNRYPIIGRDNIAAMFSNPDTSFVLSWEPILADVSKSNDLGYTYGIYRVQMDSPDGSVVEKKGTYVTIWKKQKNGEWKFVLDTGNQGLGPLNGESN